jgi:hypothetical protein
VCHTVRTTMTRCHPLEGRGHDRGQGRGCGCTIYRWPVKKIKIKKSVTSTICVLTNENIDRKKNTHTTWLKETFT